MRPQEERKVHRFSTLGFDTHEHMWTAYRDWLAKLPGRLFSEGPAWDNSNVRVAITVESPPVQVEQHVHVTADRDDLAREIDWRARTL